MLASRLAALLYKPDEADTAYVGVALVVLLLSALGATLIPARKAAGVSRCHASRND